MQAAAASLSTGRQPFLCASLEETRHAYRSLAMTDPAESDDLCRQATKAWETAAEAGVKMHKDCAKWVRQMFCESSISPSEFVLWASISATPSGPRSWRETAAGPF